MSGAAFNPEPREDEPRGYQSDVCECGRCGTTVDMPRIEAEWHGWRDTYSFGFCCHDCAEFVEAFTRKAEARREALTRYPDGVRDGEPDDGEIYGG